MKWTHEKSLAAVTGLTTRRLRQLADEGQIPKPIKSQYPTGETIKALFTYFRGHASRSAGDLRSEKARQARITADLLEMDKAQRAGELITLVQAQAVLAETLKPLREALQTLAVRTATRANPQAPAIARRAIDEAVQRILKNVSNGGK